MDTSALPYPKPRPRKLEKADRTKQRVSVDDKESAKVTARSGGRCEAVVVMTAWCFEGLVHRCQRRAVHVHHMLGGIGVRGRGESAKAIRKQHVCTACHSDIGNHVLVRIGDQMPHFTDTYRRVK